MNDEQEAIGDSDSFVQQENRDGSSRYFIHEFFVDFLGGLVPGILFVVASTVALLPAIWAIVTSISSEPDARSLGHVIYEMLSATKDTPNMIWIGAFIFVLILSYVLGHLFYRRDPKIPDVRSFLRISKQPPVSTRTTANSRIVICTTIWKCAAIRTCCR